MTIKLEGLSKTYNPKSDFPVHAVQSVDLEIKQGEFVAIMGPFWFRENDPTKHVGRDRFPYIRTRGN